MSAISAFLEHTAMFLRRIAPNALTRKKLFLFPRLNTAIKRPQTEPKLNRTTVNARTT